MRICICPGSFDPVTVGHLDIIKRAAKLFDKVIVCVMVNSAKNAMFSVEQRVDFIRRCTGDIPNVEVEGVADTLLADYAKQKNAVAVVKGLRAVSDYEYEFQQALMNKTINAQVETVFLVTDSENMFLSSSAVKEVCRLGGDIRSFVPPAIHDDIVNRLTLK
ncbi:MAG: pantetheine-phosphate adenylyltransferase [Clostridia bacterium]|nr:pantetheine-phosphate adenylyltransferase [Clostridia bacterium]